jgi:fructose-1,6-bisphosphatase/inositol monophosphatase family enzyme
MLTEVERAAIDDHRRSAGVVVPAAHGSADRQLYFGLRLVLEAGRLVRERRAVPGGAGVTVKADGSPATEVESRIEARLREWLSALGSKVVVVGEETGGTLPATGTAVAIDPIDGTRAFLAETETYSTALALIEDGETTVGIVSNPTTGEVAYATAGGPARLVRLSLFGEADAATVLGARDPSDSPTLVNLQPSRSGSGAIDALYDAWVRKDIALVRSPGGSPAWGLVEAARGHFVYVNLWSDRPAEAFDLAAAALIVRRAGGDVITPGGHPIDALRHGGPFLAGLDRTKVARVAAVLKTSVAESP